ncbi:gametolysin peptidase M11 [Nitzschia inconspicua]|uniref:Gametolysin peptidase M11 n=1 Tax=Nitzschia inconspicua TaxID=303405 RepID=A0A9K3PG46_9STRA|nr:gametolysin peptidase M11 [Nitzschia inconspicua]
MKLLTTSFFLALAVDSTVLAADSNLRSASNKPRRRRLEQKEPCTLIFQETQFYDEEPDPTRDDDDESVGGRRRRHLKQASSIKEKKEWVCELSKADAAVAASNIVRIEGIDDAFIEANDIESGENTILFEGDTIEGDAMYVANSINAVIIGESEQKKAKNAKSGKSNRRRRLAAGAKTVLVVRVNNSNDGRKTSASASQLANDIFDDAVSLRTHYAACSNNQLTFNKATGKNIVNGVISVNLNSNVNNVDSSAVRTNMQNAANSLAGFDVRNAFDHVMFCIPPGSTDSGSKGWFAYAGVGSWYSVYNDNACTYVSAQMHELGHNFYLAHSNEAGETYRDQTGMMGISYAEDDTRMCFNPVKSWQLGWYADRQKDLNPATEAPFQTTLIGTAGYKASKDSGNSNERVIIRIGNAETSGGVTYDYYIGYNAQFGINADTKEGQNQVTVTKREAGTAYRTSDLVAKLSVGGKYTINKFRGTNNKLIIQFKSRVDGLQKAVVEVYFDGLQGNFPTMAPTEPCAPGEAFFELDLTLDYWAPEDNSWTLVHDLSAGQVGSGKNFARNSQSYYSECLNSATSYTWTLTDNHGDAICCSAGNGEFIGYVNGVEIFRGGSAQDFVASKAVKKFTTPGGAAPKPNPTKAPTPSPTPMPAPKPTSPPQPAPTTAPAPAPVPAAGNCAAGQTLFELDLQLDYWAPDDNSWTVTDGKGKTVLSGSSYKRNAADSKSMCVNNGEQYTFTLLDNWGDSICCQHGKGYVRGKLGGKETFSGGEGFGKSFQQKFIAGSNTTPGANPTSGSNGNCPSGKKQLVLELLFDYWAPDDNSWTLTTGTTTVDSGSNYARNAADTRTLCLDSGKTYTFSLLDKWGDSICCSHGKGFYKGTLAGKQIFSGGEGFGKEAKATFKV